MRRCLISLIAIAMLGSCGIRDRIIAQKLAEAEQGLAGLRVLYDAGVPDAGMVIGTMTFLGVGAPPDMDLAERYLQEWYRLRGPAVPEITIAADTERAGFDFDESKLTEPEELAESGVMMLGFIKHYRAELYAAEDLFLRVLRHQQARLGQTSHPKMVPTLTALAVVYWQLADYERARQILEGADRVLADAGFNSLERFGLRSLLAKLAEKQGDFEAARRHARANLAGEAEIPIDVEVFMPFAGELSRAAALHLDARVSHHLGDRAAARDGFEEALALFARMVEDHAAHESAAILSLSRAHAQADYATLLVEDGDYRRAETLLDEARAAVAARGLLAHGEVSAKAAVFARVYAETGRRSEGIAVLRQATDAFARRALTDSQSGYPAGETGIAREAFVALVDLLREEARETGDGVFVAESFLVAQRSRATRASSAIGAMARRFAAGDGPLAALLAEREAVLGEIRAINNMTSAALTGSPTGIRAALAKSQAGQAKIDQLAARVGEIDRALARDYPDYADYNLGAPIDADVARANLGPDEALLTWLIGADRSFGWVLTRDRIRGFAVPAGAEAIRDAILRLRAGVDPAQVGDARGLFRFDAEAAWRLHDLLIAPAAAELAGKRHVFVVPDGALQSLPLGLLLTERPSGGFDDFGRFRDAPWLARDHAISVLPSVSSLRALRRFAGRTQASKPFLGVGDPILKDHPGPNAPIPDVSLRGAGVARWRARGAGVSVTGLFRGATVDAEVIRRIPSLPETAGELLALARKTGADRAAVLLRDRATEAGLRATPALADYKVVAFATHGVVAGELDGLGEPALVLTPAPAGGAPPETNDGLLTASEIAVDLELDADWVILSACNTAAPDGSPGAEGLSGLARAFFQAGARSLFVSHWPVVSSSTVRLTTAMFDALARDPSLGRAEAHRRAILSLIEDGEDPMLAHPLFWAPFVVVGEGGAP